MSVKGITETIGVILVIIFYCCATVTILLKLYLTMIPSVVGRWCARQEETILRKCVFCSSICGRNKNEEGSLEVHSTQVFSI